MPSARKHARLTPVSWQQLGNDTVYGVLELLWKRVRAKDYHAINDALYNDETDPVVLAVGENLIDRGLAE